MLLLLLLFTSIVCFLLIIVLFDRSSLFLSTEPLSYLDSFFAEFFPETMLLMFIYFCYFLLSLLLTIEQLFLVFFLHSFTLEFIHDSHKIFWCFYLIEFLCLLFIHFYFPFVLFPLLTIELLLSLMFSHREYIVWSYSIRMLFWLYDFDNNTLLYCFYWV